MSSKFIILHVYKSTIQALKIMVSHDTMVYGFHDFASLDSNPKNTSRRKSGPFLCKLEFSLAYNQNGINDLLPSK